MFKSLIVSKLTIGQYETISDSDIDMIDLHRSARLFRLVFGSEYLRIISNTVNPLQIRTPQIRTPLPIRTPIRPPMIFPYIIRTSPQT